MIEEFKKFIFKGNVIDLSTGVIIGAAFASVVGAITKGLVEPILQAMGGSPNVALGIPIGTLTDEAGKKVPNMIDIGLIINAGIGFLITAAVVFFVIVKPVNRMMALAERKRKTDEVVAEAPPVPADVALLTEIRDLLKKQA